MAPPKRSPTNADLLREVKELRHEFHQMQESLTAHNGRLAILETDKIREEAVEEYKRGEPKNGDKISTKAMVTLFTALATLVAGIVALIEVLK